MTRAPRAPGERADGDAPARRRHPGPGRSRPLGAGPRRTRARCAVRWFRGSAAPSGEGDAVREREHHPSVDGHRLGETSDDRHGGDSITCVESAGGPRGPRRRPPTQANERVASGRSWYSPRVRSTSGNATPAYSTSTRIWSCAGRGSVHVAQLDCIGPIEGGHHRCTPSSSPPRSAQRSSAVITACRRCGRVRAHSRMLNAAFARPTISKFETRGNLVRPSRNRPSAAPRRRMFRTAPRAWLPMPTTSAARRRPGRARGLRARLVLGVPGSGLLDLDQAAAAVRSAQQSRIQARVAG